MFSLEVLDGRFKLTYKKPDRRLIELVGIIAIFILVCLFLKLSWRKWCDPQIDYGRELYIPWQMSMGARWLKDVDDLYGPLSRFIDAGLFRFFGLGVMVLAWANIIIYLGILTLIYILFKRAWGLMAAICCSFVFVSIFSFSQLTIISNYNFITPYSQQVTHGFGIVLLLLYITPSWSYHQSYKRAFSIGFVAGLSAVIKPEFILASGFILIVAIAYGYKFRGLPDFKEVALVSFGLILPTVSFCFYFSSYLSFKEACLAACHAWLNSLFIWKDELTAHLLNSFSGMDEPKAHLLSHLKAGGGALLMISLILCLAFLTSLIKDMVSRVILVFFTALVIIAISTKGIVWINVGQCLLVLLILYCIFIFYRAFTFSVSATTNAKLLEKSLLCILGLSLITRMVLNGRIYQYGFIQAAVVALVIVAVLIKELPIELKLDKSGLAFYRIGLGLLLICGLFSIVSQSKAMLDAKTLSIGKNRDMFYAYPKEISGDGEAVKYFTQNLEILPNDKTLVVVPEGVMINYLSRKKSPVPEEAFYTNKKAESFIATKLENALPDYIVLITRDLKEYGVTKFGAKGQSGEYIISMIQKYYSLTNSYGQDPLSGIGVGGSIYKRIKTDK